MGVPSAALTFHDLTGGVTGQFLPSLRGKGPGQQDQKICEFHYKGVSLLESDFNKRYNGRTMDRRQFITGAAAVATARFPILGANDRINVGQVGIGGRGTDHIKYYSSLDSDCRIVAGCSVNQAARERAVAEVKKLKGATPNEFDDMRKMFESKEVDAVSITPPNHWHALAAIWACQA